jgi:alpha-beta hydrolase superfamily lysophospholipase
MVGSPAERQDAAGRIAALGAADGYPLSYRVWEPAAGGGRATLALFNGVMSHSLWFSPLAPPLLDAGFKLVGADRRGSGLSTVARGDAPSGQALLDDARAVIERERLPDRPLYLVGWCWGAALAVNLAAEMSGAVAGLALLAPGLFPTDELKRRVAAAEDGAARAPSPEEACLASPIAEEMFTSGPDLKGFIANDPHRLALFTPRFYGIMTRLAATAHLKLGRLDLPILLVLARRDEATDNRATERAFARLAAGRTTVKEVDAAHGMQFDAPQELARAIVSWIGSAAATAAAG